MLRLSAVLILVALAPAVAMADPALAPPAVEGPDAPPVTEPIAVVTALENEVWGGSAGFRGRDIAVPTGWNRVILEYTQTPIGDPWDRTFAASIAGVEVLRGTTPRTVMTIEKDVTRYASLLPHGGTARVEGYTDTYVGAMSVTLRLRFYQEPILPTSPAEDVVGVQRFGGLCTGTAFTRTVAFGDAAPAAADVELFLSGHGAEEFWFQNQGGPRVVTVSVDGAPVAQAVMLPYTYAFLGFAGANGQMGPQEETIHRAMWWTAQQGFDKAGVHVNSGEIPPFRATLAAEHVALLAGTREITVSMAMTTANVVRCTWTTSASFVLDP